MKRGSPQERMRAFYVENPLMVSSPFGGVDGINQELLARVLGKLDIDLEGRSVLDVGCGRGYMGEAVEACGGTYTGVDFVTSRKGFRFVSADACALPFPDERFDGVFCVDVFEHFVAPERVAAEFRRVLRRGGFVFLSAPNYSNVAGIVKKVYETLGLYARDTWAPFRNWKPQELETALTGRRVREAFRRGGFSRLGRIGHGGEVGLGLFPWIEHGMMPEAVKFRLQRWFNAIGPAVVRVWPGASLHGFWKIED